MHVLFWLTTYIGIEEKRQHEPIDFRPDCERYLFSRLIVNLFTTKKNKKRHAPIITGKTV